MLNVTLYSSTDYPVAEDLFSSIFYVATTQSLSLKDSFCLCIDPLYIYLIGSIIGIFLLTAILFPVIWRYKKSNENDENKKGNSENEWGIWISAVLTVSAFDFISDVNVLISSEWYTETLFYLSMLILLFQCVPFIFLISKPNITYQRPYIYLFNKLVNIIKYMFTEYKSITEMYYKGNHQRCVKIYGNGDKMGSAYFCMFMLFYLVISWCILFIIGITELLIGLSMLIITPIMCLLYILTSIIITISLILHFVFLCITGFILYCLKLLPHTNIFFVKWWWKQWNTKPIFVRCLLRSNDRVDDICTSNEKYLLTLQLVLICECIFETIPQFFLQIYNAIKLDSFSAISIISITISSFILFNLVYKYFWYFVIDRFCRKPSNEKNCYIQIHAIHQSFAGGFAPSPEAKALEKKRKSPAPQQQMQVKEAKKDESDDLECDCSILLSCGTSFEQCIASCSGREPKPEQKNDRDNDSSASCKAEDIISCLSKPLMLFIIPVVLLVIIFFHGYGVFADTTGSAAETDWIFDECVYCRVTIGHFIIGIVVECLVEILIFRYSQTPFGPLCHAIWRGFGICRLMMGFLLDISDIIGAVKSNSSWTDWQCLAYVSNSSPNWKMVSFVIIWFVYWESSSQKMPDKQRRGLFGYLFLFFVTNIVNIIFIFLIFFTHILPGIVVYIWILIPFVGITFIVGYIVNGYDDEDIEKIIPYLAVCAYLLIVVLIMYFTSVMIGFYETGNYAQSLEADLRITVDMNPCLSYKYIIRVILAVI